MAGASLRHECGDVPLTGAPVAERRLKKRERGDRRRVGAQDARAEAEARHPGKRED